MVTATDSRISITGFQLLVMTAPSAYEPTHGRREEVAILIGEGRFGVALHAAQTIGLYGDDVRRAFSDYLRSEIVERCISAERPQCTE